MTAGFASRPLSAARSSLRAFDSSARPDADAFRRAKHHRCLVDAWIPGTETGRGLELRIARAGALFWWMFGSPVLLRTPDDHTMWTPPAK